MTTAERSWRLGDRTIPVVLPNRWDARLHTAAVIISVHVIGITALGFEVSVPQIMAAIVTAGLIDVALTFQASGKLIWPASGMLTGSGVALILRLTAMGPGEYWNWSGWYWFALIAGFSVLTKYLVRRRGSHVFNPSNIGLVLAFLLLGSDLIEPLDFWWAPLDVWMAFAYLVIIGGGIAITRRLHLFEMAAVFWVVFAAGIGALTSSGHCMIATWSPTPVCDGRFWTTLVSSPEVLIFLLFMITDPKTVPKGRTARVAFAATLAVFTTLMVAPHTVEYGAKVGLLASLAVWSPLRDLFDRWLADPELDRAGLVGIGRRLVGPALLPTFFRGLALGSSLVLIVSAVIIAGVPARQSAVASASAPIEVDVDIDASQLPDVVVDPSVEQLDLTLDREFVNQLALTLAENLAIEAEAIRTADGSLLGSADGGARLDEMQARLDTALATGDRVADLYRFDQLSLRLHEAVEGQTSAGLVFAARGSIDRVRYDPDGNEAGRSTEPFQADFVLRQLAGERWLLVSVEAVDG